MFKNVFFDLDGTLMDTLWDITDALNDALNTNGIKSSFTYEDTKKMIGRGTNYLLNMALEAMGRKDAFDCVRVTYLKNYKDYQTRKTKPFKGMEEAIKALKEKGVRLYVCTNKPNELAKIIVEYVMPGIFDGVRGVGANEPVKPNPYQVDEFIKNDGLDRKECIFVGDSQPDLETARNAKLPLCLVKWGYGFYDEDWVNEAEYVATTPKEMAEIIIK